MRFPSSLFAFMDTILRIVLFSWLCGRSTTAATCSGIDHTSDPLNPTSNGDETTFEFLFTSNYAHIQGNGYIADIDSPDNIHNHLNHPSSTSTSTTRCQWTIQPHTIASTTTTTAASAFTNTTPSYYIDIYFQSLTLSGGWLELFDSRSDSNSLMFWQTSVQHLPPPIRVPANAVNIIWYGLGQGRSSVSFHLTYSAQSLLQTNDSDSDNDNDPYRLYNHPNVVKIPLRYPWAQIRSPDISKRLASNYTYMYEISPHPIESTGTDTFSGRIIIMFTHLYLPDPEDCIFIYDGLSTSNNNSSTLLARFTGTQVPEKWIQTTHSEALLVLQTNDVQFDGSFEFSFIADGETYECGYYESEIRLTGLSQVFTDGTRQSSDLRALETCRWIIQPNPTSIRNFSSDNDDNFQIQLFFNRVSIKRSAVLKVYDGNNTLDEKNVVWNCQGCLNVAPPILSSNTGTFHIVLLSDESAGPGRTGFEAEYFVSHPKSRGTGDGSMALHMASQLSITSPNKGGILPEYLDFVWYVEPTNLDPTDSVTLVFTDMNLSEDCYNNITVYDGPTIYSPLLQVICKRTLPLDWIFSSGNSLTIRLQTGSNDTIDTGDTFEFMHYSNAERYKCGYPEGAGPGIYKATSMILNDGSLPVEMMEDNLFCEWIIEPNVKAEIQSISFIFQLIDIKGGEISIYEGSNDSGNIIFHCSECSAAPERIISLKDSIYIKFITYDETVGKGTGFLAQYYANFFGSRAMGNGKETYAAASATDFRPPQFRAFQGFSSSYLMIIDIRDTGQYSINKLNNAENKSILPNKINLSFLEMNVGESDCSTDRLVLYDGSSVLSPRILQLCGNTPPVDWIVSTGPQITFELVSTSNTNTIDFLANYMADHNGLGTSSVSCGISSMPLLLRANSMFFSDGTEPTIPMRNLQKCSWLIQPKLQPVTITLVFERLKMFDSKIAVYDGINMTDKGLVWSCNSCTHIPTSLNAFSGSMFIYFESGYRSSLVHNGGFGAIYRSTVQESTKPPDSQNKLMTMPQGIINYEKYVWHLLPGDRLSALDWSVENILPYNCSVREDNRIKDGSSGRMDAAILSHPIYYCGQTALTSDQFILLKEDDNSSLVLRGSTPQVFVTSATRKNYSECYLTTVAQKVQTVISNESAFVFPTCQYLYDSSNKGMSSSANLTLSNINFPSGSSLAIYSGRSKHGTPKYTCGPKFVSNSSEQDLDEPHPHDFHSDTFCDKSNKTMHFPSSCGAIFMVYISNATESQSKKAFSAQFSWEKTSNDSYLPHQLCIDDENWVEEQDEKKRFVLSNTIYFLSGGSVFLCFLLGFIIRRKLFACTTHNLSLHRHKRASHHIEFTPVRNNLKNTFLKVGECMICFGFEKIIALSCDHKVCLECLKAYSNTALGDASMFPIKCPGYTGCKSLIDPKYIQRVLNRKEFKRFNLFNDRALFGDGISCIYCSHYVIFPPTADLSRVTCPYCNKQFCMRCQKPWHKCTDCLSRKDKSELEEWRKLTGAQKCPGCLKVIEKEDSETCNHMVHKQTDSVPCLRERTDFCYCCGTEITRDNPHFEMGTRINHFPHGVFNECRFVLLNTGGQDDMTFRSRDSNRFFFTPRIVPTT